MDQEKHSVEFEKKISPLFFVAHQISTLHLQHLPLVTQRTIYNLQSQFTRIKRDKTLLLLRGRPPVNNRVNKNEDGGVSVVAIKHTLKLVLKQKMASVGRRYCLVLCIIA